MSRTGPLQLRKHCFLQAAVADAARVVTSGEASVGFLLALLSATIAALSWLWGLLREYILLDSRREVEVRLMELVLFFGHGHEGVMVFDKKTKEKDLKMLK